MALLDTQLEGFNSVPADDGLPGTGKRQPELDGIRGLAILGVLLTHSWSFILLTHMTRPLVVAMSFGMWGVDLFFALSGFLITGILLDTRKASNFFKSFYARRFLRIFPIYYSVLVLLFCLALISPLLASLMPIRREWFSFFLYVQNIPLFWPEGFVTGHMLGHFWSLAVEEQFYCLWPIVIFLLPEGAILATCVIGLTLALPFRIYLVQHVFGSSFAEMIVTPSRMDGLLVGAIYALLVRKFRALPWAFVSVPAIAGILLIASVALVHPEEQFIGSGRYMRTYGVSGIALLCGALIGLSQLKIGIVNRLLTLGTLRFLGKYSYGLYVFHIPILIIAVTIIAPKIGLRMPLQFAPALLFAFTVHGLSLSLAILSFKYFESPILRLKSRYKPSFLPIP